MSYAYLDEYGVLHAVEDEKTAKEFSGNGKVVSDPIACEGGYPVVDGQVIVYEDGKAYVDGNERNGRVISTPLVIEQILEQLK